MATRIQWSAMERAAIAQQIRAIQARDPALGTKDMLREAQMVLPMERRRKITDGAVFVLKKWVNDIRHEPTPEPVLDPVPPPVPDPTPEPPKNPVLIEGEMLTRAMVGEAVLALVREITREVMREMRAEREREEAESERERYRDLSNRVSAGIARDNDRQQGRENRTLREHLQMGDSHFVKPQRLSVAVLGIQPAQASAVREAYRVQRFAVDFDFYDSNEAAKRTVVQRDVIIIMTKFISHSVQERWRPAAPKTFPPPFVYCNGGVTELCAEINGILKDREY